MSMIKKIILMWYMGINKNINVDYTFVWSAFFLATR